MTYFLEDIARYLSSRFEGDLRNVIVVFPNRRARLFFNYFLSRLAQKPSWSPKYYTIADFIQKLSGQQIADPLSLLFRLFTVFRKVTGSNESFDSFYYYSQMILSDFDDIDKYHVDARQLFMNLSDLKALEDYYAYMEEVQIKTLKEFWEIFNRSRDSEEKQQFLSLWDAVFTIYHEFNILLDKENLAYEGKTYKAAIHRLRSGTTQGDFSETIAFVGFNALNYSEELLFEHFRKTGNALFFWDFEKEYVEQDYHEAGHFLRKYLRKYPQPDDFIQGEVKPADQKLYAVSVPSGLAQAKVIEPCLDLLGSGDLSGPLQTAIILADEGLLIPVINSIPETVKKINISLGYPVSDTPVYNLIYQLSALQRNKRISGGGRVEYYLKDLLALFKHEFIYRYIDPIAFDNYEKDCITQNRIFVPAEEFPLNDSLTARIVHEVTDPADFIPYLRTVIEEMVKPYREEASVNKQLLWNLEVLKVTHEQLVRLESLIRDSGITFSISVLMNILQKMMGGMSVPFFGEPLDGLQVMGILETRTLDFQNLVFLSLNEGDFPKGGHAPSFIPFSLREGFGLPTIRHQDAIFSYYFYRLLHRAENVVMVYNTRTDGLQKGEPSRFIQQLRYKTGVDMKSIHMVYSIEPYPAMRIEALRNDYVNKKLERFMVGKGKSILSPSALNTYLACQLKFYFRYIEEIPEPGALKESVEADVFGSILHQAMKLLYADYEGKTISKEDINGIRQHEKGINGVIQQAFNLEYFHRPSDTPVNLQGRNLIIEQVIRSYIQGILSFDWQQAPFGIISLEKRYEWEMELEDDAQMIRLGGYIDRLDSKEGMTRVVDYKTGSKYLDFKGIDSLFEKDSDHSLDAVRQSLLYALILADKISPEHVQPALFFVREMHKDSYDPRVRDSSSGNQPLDSIGSCREDYQNGLRNTLKEIFDSALSFKQTSNTDTCQFCPYQAICMRNSGQR